jgi:hypothetical protein
MSSSRGGLSGGVLLDDLLKDPFEPRALPLVVEPHPEHLVALVAVQQVRRRVLELEAAQDVLGVVGRRLFVEDQHLELGVRRAPQDEERALDVLAAPGLGGRVIVVEGDVARRGDDLKRRKRKRKRLSFFFSFRFHRRHQAVAVACDLAPFFL